jgi:hypothetical protein
MPPDFSINKMCSRNFFGIPPRSAKLETNIGPAP